MLDDMFGTVLSIVSGAPVGRITSALITSRDCGLSSMLPIVVTCPNAIANIPCSP